MASSRAPSSCGCRCRYAASPIKGQPCWHDGWVLPADGYIARQWAAGALNPTAVLIGANSFDGILPRAA